MNGQQDDLNNRLKDYVEVKVRIQKFYEKYPQGSIQTEIVRWADGVVVMKAFAYRTPEDARPATGHAYEIEGSTQVNCTSALENCETSAVGRALALLGFEIKKSVASKEEVENAIHQQGSSPKVRSDRASALPATKEQKVAICQAITQIGMEKPEFKYLLSELSIENYRTLNCDQAEKLIHTLNTYPRNQATANAH